MGEKRPLRSLTRCPASGSLDSVADRTKLSPMKIVNMHEAKTHLSRLIQEAVAGAEIVIAK